MVDELNIYSRYCNELWWNLNIELAGKDDDECIPIIPIDIDNCSNLLSDFKDVKNNFNKYLKIKHYIKIGDECSICYEPLIHKNNVILTDCGHSFHTHCIAKRDSFIDIDKDDYWCPLCRQDMGFYATTKDRYLCIKNKLDELENFWENLKNLHPNKCHKNNHYLGMNNDCKLCNIYIKTGKKY